MYMKKITPFIISPIILILCDLILSTTSSAILLLTAWFSRLLLIPIVHFVAVGKCVKNDFDATKKYRAVVCSILLFVLSALFLTGIIIIEGWLRYSSGPLDFQTVFRIIWALLIGVVVSSLTMISTFCNDKRIFKIAVIAEAATVLIANVFMAEYFVDLMNPVDPAEVLFMLSALFLIGVLSIFVGETVSAPKAKPKLAVWLVGILVSEFASMWIVEFVSTPFHWLTLSIWLIVSILAFAPCLIKYLTNSKKSAEAA